jgi:hypothetical protein
VEFAGSSEQLGLTADKSWRTIGDAYPHFNVTADEIAGFQVKLGRILDRSRLC